MNVTKASGTAEEERLRVIAYLNKRIVYLARASNDEKIDIEERRELQMRSIEAARLANDIDGGKHCL